MSPPISRIPLSEVCEVNPRDANGLAPDTIVTFVPMSAVDEKTASIVAPEIRHYRDVAKECWEEILQHFSNAGLDQYMIMPNHVHGIIVLTDLVGTRHAVSSQEARSPQEARSQDALVRVQYIEPRQRRNEYQHIIPKSIGCIIRSFKGTVTKICRQKGLADFRWQSGFYEHVIRNARDLERIRRYILENPVNWNADDEHPGNVKPNREQMSYEGLSDLS